MSIRYGSVCSGIEAATVAWHPLGWRPSFFSEIDAAPRAVLAHHWPEVPLHGDFTTIGEGDYDAIDLLVGGTPCQSFSVAGLRGGLADDRGNLALQYLRLAQRLRPRWLVFENVPGILSSGGGRDFGSILGGLVELGYGFAYRVLDAQYVRVDGYGRAVPQRRRRVFVVGCLGDWRRAAAVLFERACLRGDPAPRREAGQIAASCLTGSLGRRGGQPDGGDTSGHLIAKPVAAALDASFGRLQGASNQDARHGFSHLVAFGGNDTRGPINVATALNAHGGPAGRLDFESETFIAFQQGGSNIGPTGLITGTLPAGNGNESGGVPCIALPIPIDMRQASRGATMTNNRPDGSSGGAPGTGVGEPGDPSPTIGTSHPPAVAVVQSCADTLTANWDRSKGAKAGNQVGLINPIVYPRAVRRLTPTECERLQGFPDGHTAVPWRGGIMPDGPRYKTLGNSMAVNCMRWIGRRIAMVDALPLDLPAPATLAAE